MGTQLPLTKKGQSAPIFGPCLSNSWMVKRALSMEVGLSPGHIVLDGDPAPLPKKGHSPQFSAHFYCGETAGCTKMPLGMAVHLSPGHIMLDGDPAPVPQKGGRAPQFSAHVYCGQTAGWIKMAPGIDVGLGPGHIVLDGDWGPSSTPQGAQPPNYGPYLLWPNGWMDQDVTWYEGRSQPRPQHVT